MQNRSRHRGMMSSGDTLMAIVVFCVAMFLIVFTICAAATDHHAEKPTTQHSSTQP